MAESLNTELDYLKNNVPDVGLEENPKFADEINTEVFAKAYGKVRELVVVEEPEVVTEKPHIGFAEANTYIFDIFKNNELHRMFPETDFENVDNMDMLYTLSDEENANAQNIVGVCLYTGNGCELNKELGMEFMERAIEQNHTAAMRNLAIALENVDAQRSLELYKRAAKLGDKTAKVNLEYMQERVNNKKLDRILSLKDRVREEPQEKTATEKGRDER